MNKYKKIKYSIKRSFLRKKTIIIKIKNGKIFILTPEKTTNNEIIQLITHKYFWILKKINDAEKKNLNLKNTELKFSNGTMVPYLGEYYPLKILQSEKSMCFENKQFLSKYHSQERIKKAFIFFYTQKGNLKISERISIYKKKVGINNCLPYCIKITNVKSYWGKCFSNSGKLHFNWKLMLFPIEVIDYVVVHELVHFIHLNHSKFFWNKVKNIIPNYKQQKLQLKQNIFQLIFR